MQPNPTGNCESELATNLEQKEGTNVNRCVKQHLAAGGVPNE
jgi:hypothetical protein